ncbi:DsbA family protein [Nocardioides massiliensis]|uniref:Protein-disulfide isomerase n=1 Tax=Nocardioides massiliensis TaxID=1325935 RepID=A0ABT9NNV2_9ACTN|nr:thioredoxin domain-containing protein [Nocardioides massiliensis]MDP9822085.1 protein-disulfide isomerase [Nocardioides massiliensis]
MAKQDSGDDKVTGGTPAARARARAAEVRAEQEKQVKRRRRINQLLAVVLVLVAGGAITAAVIAGQRTANAPAETPPNLSADGAVVLGNPDAETVLQVVEDFQCPACGQFEAVMGDKLDELSERDDLRVEFRGIAFLDRASSTEYSSRALNAAVCTVEDGEDVWRQMHAALFANQPSEGGAGLDDATLIDLAVDAGADEDRVSDCIEDRSYDKWVEQTTDATFDEGITGTPTVLLNGDKVDISTPEDLEKLVDEAVAAS